MKSFTSIKAKKRKVPVVLKRDGSYELLAGEGGEEVRQREMKHK